ncbi:hypothetical protein SOVF_151380 [Spinacia oleracea]|nr:hypothetical protein SOVF_151380 [Spinacia oleracea]
MSLCFPSFFFFFLYVLLFSFSIPHCSASDCLAGGSKISDGSSQSTLISPGKVFELGFFTPDESFNNNRYLGIWYYSSNPKIFVWVANRDKPLLASKSYLIVKDGKAEVFDIHGSSYWTIGSAVSVNSTKLCLTDHGNLILSRDQGVRPIWQSFDHPTDTILPGMMLKGSLNLTSWQNRSDPAIGNSLLLLQPGNNPKMVINEKGYPQYWDSGADPSAKIPPVLSELLNSNTSLLNNTRLVINFTGQIQLWKRERESESGSSWSLDWWEPKDRCSFDTVCGNFGSCNSNSGLPCKCLPGFRPSLPSEWNLGCFTGGCVTEFGTPSQRINSWNDTFLKLPMMKVGETDCTASTEQDCKARCLNDITCVAYSVGIGNCRGTGSSTEKRCLMWANQLPRLQEEYSQGLTLFLRTPSSGIESTKRDCKPCGAYVIPYPLSTGGASCGDSLYSKLHCNSETGQVNFSTPTGTFRVTLINPDAKQFTIQVMRANSCDSEYIESFVLPSKNSVPFFLRNCTVFKDYPLIQLGQPFIEVDIGWKPPSEPTCSVYSDCVSWPDTTCKGSKGGTRRCICRSNFRWDGSKLKCTRVPFPVKAVAPCIAVALAIILLSGAFFVYRKRERRIAEKQGSLKFKGDDTEGVDVPFYSWGSILSATNNFADTNKLGTGGFGSVYMIAIKSIMWLCYSIFLIFLFSFPILHCSASDCLEEGSVVTDDTSNNTLVSPGKVFELGFFTPDGNTDNRRYLGIWYFNPPNPKIIVWVANRDKPLLESNGSFVFEHRKVKLFDGEGLVYWSTDDFPSGRVQSTGPKNPALTFNSSKYAVPAGRYGYYSNRPFLINGTRRVCDMNTCRRSPARLCLRDNGNLVLSDLDQGNQVLWQSFAHPTDTFLPGMSLDGSLLLSSSNLNLTSWQNHNHPEKGNFTLLLQLGTVNNWVIVEGRHSHYWESKTNPFDKNASALSGILELGDNSFLQKNNTLIRLVMSFTGQVQFWNWESDQRSWSLKWSEPKDVCSLYNKCGVFSTCNSNNAVVCKCLPGFKPSAQWNSGDTSGGCSPISSPSNRNDSSSDIFLPLPMMTVGNGTCTISAEVNCTAECLNDPACVAYSFGLDCSGAGTSTDEKRCLLWSNVLNYLQEESPDGITIYLRTTRSDIESKSRVCKPCGTYIIPYPLSTATNCGDPSYFNFKCNETTGQIYFSTGILTYKVTSFDPVAKKFTIQIGQGNSCDEKSFVLSPKDSLQYKSYCKVVKDQSFLGQSFIEVEMGWKAPSEPACSAPSDCYDWPHTSCKTRGGKMSCICGSRFHWDGRNLKCNKVVFLKVVIPCIAGALAVFLLCGIYFIYCVWKRRPDELQGSVEFKGDDAEGIDETIIRECFIFQCKGFECA